MLRLPWSSSTAEFQVARRARCTFVAMSAMMNWIAWCIAIGTPNWTRSLEYVDRELHRRAGDAGRHRGDAGARAVERHHRDLEALVLLADQVVERDLDLGEGDRRGVRGALAHLVLVLVDDHAGVTRDDEARDAAVPGLLVGLRVDRVPVGVLAVGDEALGAVDDPLVALAGGGRLHPGDVRAGVGLGQAERGEQRRLGQPAEVLLLELLGGGQRDRRGGEAVAGDSEVPMPGAAPGELLLDDAAVEVAEARAAVLGREGGCSSDRAPRPCR